MAKLARAQYHARFAEWLLERTGEELVEIRAYHLDQAVEFLTELEGAPPEELAEETGEALVKAARRAMAREAYANARTLGLRAVELKPDARGALRRGASGVEAAGLVSSAGGDGAGARPGARGADTTVRGAALTALAEASLKRDGDAVPHESTIDEALELLDRDKDAVALFEALSAGVVGAWLGSQDDYVRYMERAYAVALDARRKDLQTIAAQALAQARMVGLELDEAELLITRALELAGESGSVARG